jgi:hypothetical protein
MSDLTLITQIMSAVTSHAASLIPRLQDQGLWLVTALGVIAGAYRLLELLVFESPPGHFLAHVLIYGIKLSIIAWIITSLPSLSLEFQAGFDIIAAKLAGAGDGSNILQSEIGSVLNIAQSVWNSVSAPGLWETLKGGLGPAAASLFAKLAIILIVLALAVLQAGMYLMSQILVSIGLCLAPIFLPFAALELLSFLADGLIRFLITSSVVKLIGVVMLSFVSVLTGFMAQIASASAAQDGRQLDLVTTFLTLFVVGLMLFLTYQTFVIANGLVSGSVMVSPPRGVASGIKSSATSGMAKMNQMLSRIAQSFKNR